MQEEAVEPRTILTTLGISAIAAIVSLVLFVLPAEYDIDPLGVGALLGIKGMAGYNVQALSVEAEGFKKDTVSFPLGPFESVEYKYRMQAGQAMVYTWKAGGEVVFDFHSEESGSDPEDAVSFSIGRAEGQNGTYVAPYDGIHGWFWENRGQQEVTVELVTHGFFRESITYSRSGEYVRKL